MATVIEREVERPSRRLVIERERDSGAGWAVALVLILAVLVVAAFAYMRYYRTPAASTTGPSINVSIPAASTPAGGTGNTAPTTGTGGAAPATGN